MPAYTVTKANVSCVTAYPINVILTALMEVLSCCKTMAMTIFCFRRIGTFTFSTPVADHDRLFRLCARPARFTGPDLHVQHISHLWYRQWRQCKRVVNCVANPSPAVDRYAYAANYGSNTVSAYAINAASGVLATTITPSTVATGTGPSAVAVDPAGQFAYVTNQTANSISAYSIGGSGALTLLGDVDAGTSGTQTSIATGTTPVSIKIHPSGKFAYVVNSLSNSVSAYSIDAHRRCSPG